MALNTRNSETVRFPERCEVRLCPEPDGGYSVYVPGLPGVLSEGETRDEAIRNIIEALDAALLTYREARMPVPWRKPVDPLAEGGTQTWIYPPVRKP